MSVFLDHASVSHDLLSHWWHDAGSLALRLPDGFRREWLEAISQVIRYYRSFLRGEDPSDRHMYRSLCQLSLTRTRAELSSLLVAGYLTLPQMQHLYDLEKQLEASLEK